MTDADEQVWLALSDRTRRSIMTRLAQGELAVGDLVAHLPISQPAVSQHLKALKDLGLVSDRAEGNRRIYRLNPVGVLALRDQMDAFWRRTLAGFDDVVSAPGRPDDLAERAPNAPNASHASHASIGPHQPSRPANPSEEPR